MASFVAFGHSQSRDMFQSLVAGAGGFLHSGAAILPADGAGGVLKRAVLQDPDPAVEQGNEF